MDHIDAERLIATLGGMSKRNRPPGALSIGCGVFLGIFVFPIIAIILLCVLSAIMLGSAGAIFGNAIQKVAPQQQPAATPTAPPANDVFENAWKRALDRSPGPAEKPPTDNGAAAKP